MYMAEVIPAIIAKDFRELKKKIRLVEPYIEWVQLDVMDGKFVPNETFNEPKKIKKIKTKLKIEAHLMIQNPSRAVNDWLGSGCQRIIVHWESIKKSQNPQLETKKLIEKIHNSKREIGMAINPETDWREIREFIPELDLVLVMTVSPGFGGQKFKKEVIPKIESLRKFFPDVKIEVDGGISKDTGKLAVEAGADILVVGSAIFESKSSSIPPRRELRGKNIKKAIIDLKNVI